MLQQQEIALLKELLNKNSKNSSIITGNNSIRFAPLFDNSLTSIGLKISEEISKGLIFSDLATVNNFIGERNLQKNLGLINRNIELRDIVNSDKEKLFQGLYDITTKEFRDYVWNELRRRVNYVKSIQFIKWR